MRRQREEEDYWDKYENLCLDSSSEESDGNEFGSNQAGFEESDSNESG